MFFSLFAVFFFSTSVVVSMPGLPRIGDYFLYEKAAPPLRRLGKVK